MNSINREEEDIRLVVPPKKRKNPEMPYPDANVIALSPTSLMKKNRFICEVCNKGFPREQNLELHKRGHNLPWKLKQQRTGNEIVRRKVYLCPEPSCVHHDPSRALGDLTGIKKHYFRKHGEKKYKCRRCTKVYAVESDLKAHSKICGKKEYQCHCEMRFTRHDSFLSHKAFCDYLAQSGPIKYPPAMSSKEIGSSSNNQPIRMNKTLPELDKTSKIIRMIKPLMLSPNKSCKPLFIPSKYQSNEHKYEASSDTMFFTNLVNNNTTMPRDNKYNFMGSDLPFRNDRTSIVIRGRNSNHSTTDSFSSHTYVMPQLPTSTLFQNDSLIGSTSNTNRATNFAECYPISSSSASIHGNDFEKGKFPFGSEFFGKTGNNGHDSNMIELLNPFTNSGVGSSTFNLNSGAAYGQEESRSRGYDNIWKFYNSEDIHQPENTLWNIDINQSTGVRFTRDFLGIGDK